MGVGRKWNYGDKGSNFNFQKRLLQMYSDCCGIDVPAARYCYEALFLNDDGVADPKFIDISIDGIVYPNGGAVPSPMYKATFITEMQDFLTSIGYDNTTVTITIIQQQVNYIFHINNIAGVVDYFNGAFTLAQPDVPFNLIDCP